MFEMVTVTLRNAQLYTTTNFTPLNSRNFNHWWGRALQTVQKKRIKHKQCFFKRSNLTKRAIIYTEINQGLSVYPDVQTFVQKNLNSWRDQRFVFFPVTGLQFYLSEEVKTFICVFLCLEMFVKVSFSMEIKNNVPFTSGFLAFSWFKAERYGSIEANRMYIVICLIME